MKIQLIRHFARLAIALAFVPTDTLAQSQRSCAPRDTIVERLQHTYGETRRSVGLGSNNAMVEVFASEESGSWTITITTPTGLTCLVATGQAFEVTKNATELVGDQT